MAPRAPLNVAKLTLYADYSMPHRITRLMQAVQHCSVEYVYSVLETIT